MNNHMVVFTVLCVMYNAHSFSLCAAIFVILYHVHRDPMDENRAHRCLGPPQVDIVNKYNVKHNVNYENCSKLHT